MKNFPQFVVIHTAKGFSIVNEAEVDVFLELSCFLCDLMDVGNLISGSSAFSKSIFKIYIFINLHESESRSVVTDSVTPWTVACQAPLSMEFSRPEYWSGLPFPSLEDLPNPGIEPKSPTL